MIEFAFPINGTDHTFRFTAATCKKFAQVGGSMDMVYSNPVGLLEAFIRAFLADESAVSATKAEKMAEDIISEYAIDDIMAIFIKKYSEVFTLGEKKILSEIDPTLMTETKEPK